MTEERIIRGMVGREMSSRFPQRENTIQDEVAFEVKIGQYIMSSTQKKSGRQCIPQCKKR